MYWGALGDTGVHWGGYWDVLQGSGTYLNILGCARRVIGIYWEAWGHTGGTGRLTGMYCRALRHTGIYWGALGGSLGHTGDITSFTGTYCRALCVLVIGDIN